MRQRHWLLPMGLAIATLVSGCGGSSGSGTTSPFAGQWSGSWSDTNGHQGQIAATVARDGKMTTNLTDDTNSAVGTGQGQVLDRGSFSLTYEWNYTPVLVGTGTLTLDETGRLRGSMVSKLQGATQGTTTLELTKAQ